MKKRLISALILIFFVSIIIVCIQPIKAQNPNYITINADGSITPASAPILQSDNLYSMTSDINGTIHITKNNITFNGNGYTINQHAITQDSANAFGITLSNVYNVTVTNTTITNTGNGIYAIQNPTAGINIENGGSNTIVRNDIVNNYNAMSLLETKNNLIVENNIINNRNPYVIVSALMLWGSSYNSIYRNNFIDNTSPAGTASFNSQSQGNKWDNGMEGNFWDNYNGTDTNGDGIGDSPYQVDIRNTDHYPLMSQVDIVIQTHTPSPTVTTTISPTPTVPEFSWLAILPLLLSIFSVVVVLRHRKTRNQRK